MKLNRKSRRLFLQGLGGFTLALPFLPSLLPRSARAGTYTGPRRLIAIKSYSTQNIIDWYPTFSGNGYEVRNAGNSQGNKADGTTILNLPIDGGYGFYAPLSDFSDPGISPILDAQFNPYLEKMLLLRGLDVLPSTNHNHGAMLGNYAACEDDAGSQLQHVPTIDQVLAYSDKFYPQNPIVRSLHLAPGAVNTFSFTDDGIDGGEIRQVQAHLDPLSAFNEIFNAPGVNPPDEEPMIDPNLKLVDGVYEDYVRVRDGSRISTVDRELLERHMSFLSELQDNLENAGGVACTWPEEPRSISDEYGLDVMDIGDAYSLMIDVLIAAIICDHTRIVTLDVRKALSDGRGDLAGYYHGADGPSTWHGDAHSWGDQVSDYNILRLNQWIASDIVLKVIERMDVLEADDSTYLDNSIVFWGNELGFNHLNWAVPALLFGSAGGCLNTGRVIDYIHWDNHSYFSQQNGNVIEGIPYNRLMVALLQAMGLEPADYERDGISGYGVTDTAGKDPNLHAIDYDFGSMHLPIPDVLV